MEKERRLLVIFPHPDDEAFGVSGTIASYVQQGTPVTYVCLTLGEMGRNMGNPPFATRESLPSIRKKELKEAVNVLGIEDLRMLGYRDKTIEFLDEELLINQIHSIIQEVDPSLIISFYPGYSVHPDHDACGAAVVNALKRMEKEKRPKLHCVAFAKNSEQEIGPPQIIHDISPFSKIKLAAIAAHRSQTQSMISNLEKMLENGEPDAIARVHIEKFWVYPFS